MSETMKREPYPDGNPKTAAGLLKTPLRLVPTIGIEAEARVFKLGAAKYGAYNWRELDVSCSVYYEAAIRHLFAWYNGEDIDPESGEPHIAHVRACMGILLDAEAHGKLNDDRPPRPNACLPPLVDQAWNLYCEETAGGMDVRDTWDDLPGDVQLRYLGRALRNNAKPEGEKA